MKFGRILKAATLAVSTAGVIGLVGIHMVSMRVHADDGSDSEEKLDAIGLSIAPSFINKEGKDPTLVGLGSFIVNAQVDCNGCHGSDPASEFLPANNPYFLAPLNGPTKYNPATYLSGGHNFGAVGPGIVKDPTSPLYAGPGLGPNIISRNLTPDHTGNPEGGNDLEKFIKIIRTGHDFDKLHLNCSSTVTDNCYNFPVNGGSLQVMPWPNFQHMTDRQLTAIWTYLSTVPCNAHDDALGTSYPWLQQKCQ
jgi:hypothetical protein